MPQIPGCGRLRGERARWTQYSGDRNSEVGRRVLEAVQRLSCAGSHRRERTWLVAVVGTGRSCRRGTGTQRLERELGTDADDAAQRAGTLLSKPHPAVRAAAAVWARSDLVGQAFGSWAGSLPYVIERGEMPGQSQADRWAALHTDGLIRNFPLKLDEFTAVVLASALATVVSWSKPFVAVPGSELGGEFGASITTALRAPRGHVQCIVDTDAAGLVGVHAADTDEGLRVISVIAAREVTPDVVHLAASQVAVGPRQAPRGREGDRLVRPAVG